MADVYEAQSDPYLSMVDVEEGEEEEEQVVDQEVEAPAEKRPRLEERLTVEVGRRCRAGTIWLPCTYFSTPRGPIGSCIGTYVG